MKKTLIILITAATLFGCYAGPQGELVGVYPRENWIQVNPYGMNYIHLGSYTMGPSDQDVPFALNTRSKTVSEWPAAMRFLAMGPPILPRPKKAIVAMIYSGSPSVGIASGALKKESTTSAGTDARSE